MRTFHEINAYIKRACHMAGSFLVLEINNLLVLQTIDVPQDRKSTFEPQVVKKRQKDISGIDQKIISI